MVLQEELRSNLPLLSNLLSRRRCFSTQAASPPLKIWSFRSGRLWQAFLTRKRTLQGSRREQQHTSSYIEWTKKRGFDPSENVKRNLNLSLCEQPGYNRQRLQQGRAMIRKELPRSPKWYWRHLCCQQKCTSHWPRTPPLVLCSIIWLQ